MASSEVLPPQQKTPNQVIDSLVAARDILQTTFDTLGTNEYTSNGGISLNLESDDLSGESRLDAAIKVGRARKRIREEILPRLEERIIAQKTEIVKSYIESGYLPDSVLPDTFESVETEEALPASLPQQPEEHELQEGLPASVQGPEQPDTVTVETDIKLPRITVDRAKGVVTIDGREKKFQSPDSASFVATLFLVENAGRDIPKKEFGELCKTLGRTPGVVMFDNLRRRLEEDPRNPVITTSTPGRDGFFRINGTFAFEESLEDPELELTEEDQSAIATNGLYPSDNESPASRITEATADEELTPLEPSIDMTRDGERPSPMQEPEILKLFEEESEHQRTLRQNIALTLLSYMSASSEPESRLKPDAIAFIHKQIRGVVDMPSLPYDEKLFDLTGKRRNDELPLFLLDSFRSSVVTYWDLNSSQVLGTRERQIIEYCTAFNNSGIRKDDVVREVCRFFNIPVPQDYQSEFFHPSIMLHSDR